MLAIKEKKWSLLFQMIISAIFMTNWEDIPENQRSSAFYVM